LEIKVLKAEEALNSKKPRLGKKARKNERIRKCMERNIIAVFAKMN